MTSLAAVSSTSAGNVDSTFKYAWGENIGWVNFGTTEGDVTIGASELTGYAWSENTGWISLNCANTSSCSTVDYKVTRSGEVLSGYAWGENVGWVAFNCLATGTCGTVNYGVTMLLPAGDLYGYAWGENVGWISFNCLNTVSCGTISYRVSITTTGGGENSVVIIPSQTPTPSIVATVSATPILSGTITPAPTTTGQVQMGTTTTPAATLLTTKTLPPAVYVGGGGTTSPLPSLPPVAQSTPSSGPSGLSPSNPPPTFAPSGPGLFESIADRAGNAIDRAGETIFGGVAPVGDGACDGAVGVTACGATAVGVVVVSTALVVGLFQGEWLAAVLSLLSLLGLHQESRSWGRVYDTATKRPLPFAKVQLFDGLGHHLKTNYADRDGRYGFSTSLFSGNQSENRVTLKASKPGYQFPSSQHLTDTDYFVYDHPYRGDAVSVAGGIPSFNIPLDPQAATSKLYDFGTQLFSRATNRFIGFAFFVGLFAVPINYYASPTIASLTVLFAFLAFHFFRIVAFVRPQGVIVDASTGKALPYALVVLRSRQGARVNFAVSDKHGRYVLPAEGGQYQITVHTPAHMSPTRTAEYQAAPRSGLGKTAWITATLRI